MSLWILEIEFDNILGHSGLDSGPYRETKFSANFHRGSIGVV